MTAICPKCHDSGFQFEQRHSAEAVIAAFKWCDCLLAKRYIASIRQLGQSQAVLKHKIALIQRNAVERLLNLATERQKTPSAQISAQTPKKGK